MELKVKHTASKDIRAYIYSGLQKQKEEIVRRLFLVGEKCVNDARINGSYKDQTGNLRGSTGYCITVDGVIQTVGGFSAVKGSEKGPSTGKAFVEKLAAETPGIALIVVAGMNYAKYVADRGYNVLDSAELLAEKLIEDMQKSTI